MWKLNSSKIWKALCYATRVMIQTLNSVEVALRANESSVSSSSHCDTLHTIQR